MEEGRGEDRLEILSQFPRVQTAKNRMLRILWDTLQVGSTTVACYDSYEHFCYQADPNLTRVERNSIDRSGLPVFVLKIFIISLIT